ncbi:hypothetical protein GQ55_9G033600 [Panicum hallii var. hallii]|uniref:Tubby C-terminal domain-containing protein n=1 Tax=Panicum hallii var. hallii TaxID=1504633 RepID=A0A2T7BZ71_9POAL|nr:hypothetical protein GQ55_9G033600 [Panicum hallii var. hallii]
MDAPAPATAAAEAPAPAVKAVVNFCAPEATAFAVVKTISYSGRDFITVKDAAGAAVMQVEAEVLANPSSSTRRAVPCSPCRTRPCSGAPGGRCSIRGDSASRRNLLFTVVKPSSFQIRTKIYIFLAGNAREEAPEFAIWGSYHDGACTITRRNTVQLLGFGRNVYTARINPGVDQAFVLALTVILDEML